MEEHEIEQLRLLGVDLSKKRTKRLLELVRSMMRTQQIQKRPQQFHEIYDAIQRLRPDDVPSRTCIYRDLKLLKEAGVVRVSGRGAQRKKYSISTTSLIAGLHRLHSTVVEQLEAERNRIERQLEMLRQIDCSKLGERIAQSIVGTEAFSTVSFAKGADGMHQLVLEGITRPASRGDVIRVMASFARPLVRGGIERTKKFIEAAQRGAEVRYLAPFSFLRVIDIVPGAPTAQAVGQFIVGIGRMRKQGLRFEIRLHREADAYNAVIRNRDAVALILVEEPIATTMMTREYAADLIDQIVERFDRVWKQALPLEKLTRSMLRENGIESSEAAAEILHAAESSPRLDDRRDECMSE